MKSNGKIPLFTDSPEYVEAKEKLVQLQLRLSQNDKQLTNTYSAIAAAKSETKVDAMAASILADPGADIDDLKIKRPSLEKLNSEKNILIKAVALQQKIIAGLEQKLSKAICEEIRPQYMSIVKETEKALRALSEVIENERSFRGALDVAGIHSLSYIPPVPVRRIGTLKDEYSYVRHWLKEAVDAGYIKKPNGEFKTTEPDLPPQGKECLACGPDGVRQVVVKQGGYVETKMWLHKTKKEGIQKAPSPGSEW